MAKNVQTTRQLHLFYMLARFYSKCFKLGFSSMCTENFQMYKMGLEKAEEPEIKLSTFTGSQRKQGNSRKTSSASLTTLKPLTVDHNKLWKTLKETGIPNHLTCLLRNPYVAQEATLRTLYEIAGWFKIKKGVQLGCL